MTATGKPKCNLVGEDGNIFVLVGVARRALERAGLRKESLDMSNRVFEAGSYDEALGIICEYVEAE